VLERYFIIQSSNRENLSSEDSQANWQQRGRESSSESDSEQPSSEEEEDEEGKIVEDDKETSDIEVEPVKPVRSKPEPKEKSSKAPRPSIFRPREEEFEEEPEDVGDRGNASLRVDYTGFANDFFCISRSNWRLTTFKKVRAITHVPKSTKKHELLAYYSKTRST
jgi:hypothetical protein